VEQAQIESTREHLSQYFEDEKGWQESVPAGLPEWFDALAQHVASLSLADACLFEAATYMKPILENNPDLAVYAMYPEGNAVGYLQEHWGGRVDEFFSGFVAAMAEDHATWAEGGFRPPAEAVESTRRFLVLIFANQDGWQESARGHAEWFDTLGRYVSSLPLEDQRLVDAAAYSEPLFLADPDLHGCCLYPDGKADDCLDQWGGDTDQFFSNFVAALAEDFANWAEGGFRPSTEAVEFTRKLVAGLFANEKGSQESVPAGLPEWFDTLAQHVASLPLDDDRLVDTAAYMGPLFEADPDLDGCLLYPNGKTLECTEKWGGDVDQFFFDFVAALAEDYATWEDGGFRPTLEHVEAVQEHLSSLFAGRKGAIALCWPNDAPRGLDDWFIALADYVESLPLDDPTLVEATRHFVPFLTNDVDLEGYGMYPRGEAAEYLNNWGGDPSKFFSRFAAAMRVDYVTWSDGSHA
jgi:hypothetical protein